MKKIVTNPSKLDKKLNGGFVTVYPKLGVYITGNGLSHYVIYEPPGYEVEIRGNGEIIVYEVDREIMQFRCFSLNL